MKLEIEKITKKPFKFFIQKFENELMNEKKEINNACHHETKIDKFETKLKIENSIFTIIDHQYSTKELNIGKNKSFECNPDFNLSGRVISVNGYEFEMISKNISKSDAEGFLGEDYFNRIPKDVLNFIEYIKKASIDNRLSLIGEQNKEMSLSIQEKENINLCYLNDRYNTIKSKIEDEILFVDKKSAISIFLSFDGSVEEIKKAFDLYKIIEKTNIDASILIINNLLNNGDYFNKGDNKLKIDNIKNKLKSILYLDKVDYEELVIDLKKIIQIKKELMDSFKFNHRKNMNLSNLLNKINTEIEIINKKEKKNINKTKAGEKFMNKINQKRIIELIRLPEFILKKILYDKHTDLYVIENHIEINEALNNSNEPAKLLDYFNMLSETSQKSAVFFASTNNENLISSVVNKYYKEKSIIAF